MRMQRSAGENSGRGKRTAGSGGKLRADSKGGRKIRSSDRANRPIRPPWYEAMGERIPEEVIRGMINESPELAARFEELSPERQRHFLDMCSGARGMAVCYDPFFKYIFNPMIHRQRLSRFLSSILNRQVRVRQILPNEGGRIVAGSPFVIMDIVVELEDRSLANAEIQKAGHLFPGQRAACYSSDLVLRQYTAIKGDDMETALYLQMRSVYTIVIMEESVEEFHRHPEAYIHRGRQQFDTGLKMPLLQEYVFIPLDVYRKKLHNKAIETELEAWLGFLAFDDLERIWEISRYDPVFGEMYYELSEFRRKPKEVLGMFSEALLQLDRNDAKYYAETLRKKAEALEAELQSRDAAMRLKDDEIAELRKRIERLEGRQ